MARVKVDWIVPLPGRLELKQAMAIGTAGFTAMLCVMVLEDHGLKPGRDHTESGEIGEVVVTGAAGGVGSVAVALLAKENVGWAAGFLAIPILFAPEIIASTSKKQRLWTAGLTLATRSAKVSGARPMGVSMVC